MPVNLIPYNAAYDEAIHQLEEFIVQGKGVQLTIMKGHFLDRSKVFKNFYACLGINNSGEPIATSIAAQTSIIINREQFDAGFAYDVKVHPDYRNRGLGRMMAKFLYKQFFRVKGLKRNFTTLKLSNVPVIRLASKAVSNIWLYHFVYLTIPCTARIKEPLMKSVDKQLFNVTLFDEQGLDASYYTSFSNALGYFHTYQMYRLKIHKIGFLISQGIRFMKKFRPRLKDYLPRENDILECVTLYNHNERNICHINELLEQLEKDGKAYLLVSCRRNDCIYNLLKKQSINTYGYYILSDFPLRERDELTIDVRCL